MLEVVGAGIAAMAAALSIAAAVSNIHGHAPSPSGDRIFLGLVAMPLYPLLAHLCIPELALWLKLSTVAPVAIYITLLASTNWNSFVRMLYLGVMSVYAAVGILLLVGVR